MDPVTGEQSLISNNTISGPNLFDSPTGIDVDPAGRIFVLDEDSVVAVNYATGEQSAVTNDSISNDDLFDAPATLTSKRREPDRHPDQFSAGGAVIGVDAAGQQSYISTTPSTPDGLLRQQQVTDG